MFSPQSTYFARIGYAISVYLLSATLYADVFRAYVGTYTGGDSRGIYAFTFDSETGNTGVPQLVAETNNPSFVAFHGDGQTLYAVNEVNEFEGQASGAVSSFRVSDDGSLKFLNQLATGGSAPCHLVVDATNQFLLVANYNGGNASVFRLANDGSIHARTDLVQHIGSSVNRRRQNEPHAHSINLDPQNRFAAVADLGVDKVFVYPLEQRSGRFDLSRASSVSLPPGGGPRHFAFHPNGKLAFTNNELLSSLSSLRYDRQTGQLEVIETVSTLPADYEGGNSTAETQISPNGRVVYVSNRGHNSIAVFELNPDTGGVRRIQNESTGGKTPRNFRIDPTGKYLFAANQSSNSVVLLGIDAETGRLSQTSKRINVPSPVCIRFLRIE